MESADEEKDKWFKQGGYRGGWQMVGVKEREIRKLIRNATEQRYTISRVQRAL